MGILGGTLKSLCYSYHRWFHSIISGVLGTCLLFFFFSVFHYWSTLKQDSSLFRRNWIISRGEGRRRTKS